MNCIFAISGLGPNNSFKPNLLRYTNNVAGRACHVVGYATQVGLTQVLELIGEFLAIPTTPKEKWAALDQIESNLQLKSDNEPCPETGWTEAQRLMGTVNEIHCRAYRIERRQDVLFAIVTQSRASQRVNSILLVIAILILLYLASQ